MGSAFGLWIPKRGFLDFFIKLLWPPKRSSEPLGERDRVGGPTLQLDVCLHGGLNVIGVVFWHTSVFRLPYVFVLLV